MRGFPFLLFCRSALGLAPGWLAPELAVCVLVCARQVQACVRPPPPPAYPPSPCLCSVHVDALCPLLF